MVILRSALFNVLFYAALIGIMLVLSPAILLGPPFVRGAARVWGRASLWLLRVVCGTRVEFRGLENVPEGGCIVASKHQSMWEVFALITVFQDFTFVMKRELTRIPLFGWYIARGDQIAIDRAKGRAALAQIETQARRLLGREGRQLIIFPEGTRKPPGAPPAYKFGVAHIYAGLGVRCVPVALNSGLFWQRRSFLRRPGTVVVEIMPPIEPGVPAAEFLRRIEAEIESATARLNAEAIARDPSLAALLQPQPAAADTPA